LGVGAWFGIDVLTKLMLAEGIGVVTCNRGSLRESH
jgi:hypothetical protein